MPTETFTDPAAFLDALHGKRVVKRGRAARPGIPAAAPSARTGLTTLLQAGWNVAYDAAMRMRLYRGALDTGYYEDDAACCAAAKALGKG